MRTNSTRAPCWTMTVDHKWKDWNVEKCGCLLSGKDCNCKMDSNWEMTFRTNEVRSWKLLDAFARRNIHLSLYIPFQSRIIHTFNIRIFVCKFSPFNGLTTNFHFFTRPKPEQFLVPVDCSSRTQTSLTVGAKTLSIFTGHFGSFWRIFSLFFIVMWCNLCRQSESCEGRLTRALMLAQFARIRVCFVAINIAWSSVINTAICNISGFCDCGKYKTRRSVKESLNFFCQRWMKTTLASWWKSHWKIERRGNS